MGNLIWSNLIQIHLSFDPVGYYFLQCLDHDDHKIIVNSGLSYLTCNDSLEMAQVYEKPPTYVVYTYIQDIPHFFGICATLICLFFSLSIGLLDDLQLISLLQEGLH